MENTVREFQINLGRVARGIITASTLLFLIVMAIITIVEVSTRITARAFLDTKINQVHERLSSQPPDSTKTQNDTSTTDLRNDLLTYQRLKDQVTTLEFAGATGDATTSYGIRDQLQSAETLRRLKTELDITESKLVDIESELDRQNIQIDRTGPFPIVNVTRAAQSSKATDTPDINYGASFNSLQVRKFNLIKESDEAKPKGKFWLSEVPLLRSIVQWPSDILLALAVIACGGIGAGVSGMRRRTGPGNDNKDPVRFEALRDVVLGLSAGFVAFLVIKGGKFLFIVQTADANVPINPFAMAFAGILAGLFTEQAYKVLSTLFTQAAERLTGQDDPNDPKTPKDQANVQQLRTAADGG